jgi:heme-degrading monooxygenase HmoA
MTRSWGSQLLMSSSLPGEVIVFILNVDLYVKSGSDKGLENIFKDNFVPAISKQDGFSRTQLLRPRESESPYRLVIEFQSLELQQKWVAQPLHQDVWSQMGAHFSKYSAHNYDSI